MDPDFLSAVNSCLLPKKSQFFFWKKPWEVWILWIQRSTFFTFLFTRYLSDCSSNLTVGIFVFFFRLEVSSNFEGVHQPGSLDPSHSERSSGTEFPSRKTKEQPPPDKKKRRSKEEDLVESCWDSQPDIFRGDVVKLPGCRC